MDEALDCMEDPYDVPYVHKPCGRQPDPKDSDDDEEPGGGLARLNLGGGGNSAGGSGAGTSMQA